MIVKKYQRLIIALAIPLLVGFIGSLFTNPSIKSGWYLALRKPSIVPPGFVFPIVWTILFIMMGLAFYFVWQKAKPAKLVRPAYWLFALQLVLNVFWSVLFFYFQKPSWSLIEIILLWFAILFTLLTFKKIDRRAGWLMLPYLLWVSFAFYLNYAIALG